MFFTLLGILGVVFLISLVVIVFTIETDLDFLATIMIQIGFISVVVTAVLTIVFIYGNIITIINGKNIVVEEIPIVSIVNEEERLVGIQSGNFVFFYEYDGKYKLMKLSSEDVSIVIDPERDPAYLVRERKVESAFWNWFLGTESVEGLIVIPNDNNFWDYKEQTP